MHTHVVDLRDVGSRLRAERGRLGHSQEEFAAIAGVTRNSQGAYEAGRRPFDANYLLALAEVGVDVAFLVTGKRSSGLIDSEAGALLDDWRQLGREEQVAVADLVQVFAGRPGRSISRVHGGRHAYEAPQPILPSESALADAFEGFLLASEGLPAGELARELAKHLPIVLESAGDARPSPGPVRHDAPAGLDQALPGEHRASGRAHRR